MARGWSFVYVLTKAAAKELSEMEVMQVMVSRMNVGQLGTGSLCSRGYTVSTS